MTYEEALELFELGKEASSAAIEAKHNELYNEYQLRITNAPTDNLRVLYRKNLQRLEEAYTVLTGNKPNFQYLPSIEPLYDIEKTSQTNIPQTQNNTNKQEIDINVAKLILGLGKKVNTKKLNTAYLKKKKEYNLELKNPIEKVQVFYKNKLGELEEANAVLKLHFAQGPTDEFPETSNKKNNNYLIKGLILINAILLVFAIVYIVKTFVVGNESTNIADIEFVFVEGGSFPMGSNNGDEDERPVHEVYLSDFYIGKYEISQKQWYAVMGNAPEAVDNKEKYPISNISWNDIQEFIKKLGAKTGKTFRLPTEAEWEYAARGGNQSDDYTFSGSNKVEKVACYKGNSSNKMFVIGKKKANELGIHDMSGNVWEWCSDWEGPYEPTGLENPQGPSTGESRIVRGGCWNDDAPECRSTFRDCGSPTAPDEENGFRLVYIP